MWFAFRSSKENPVWDYYLTLSHTQTSLIAFRKDENNNQQYVGLVFRLHTGYGASSIPTDCIGGCKHVDSKPMQKCPTEQKLFSEAVDGVEWVMKRAGMQGPVPHDLKEPDSFRLYDKSKPGTNGFWNGLPINYSGAVADQKKVEPPFTGKENTRVADFKPYRPEKKAYEPKAKSSVVVARPAAVKERPLVMPEQAVRKDISIEEHLEAAISDVKEAFNFNPDEE